MPKIRIRAPPNPYMEHLHLGQMGARRLGANDRLLKKMAQDFSINSSWYLLKINVFYIASEI